MELYKYVTSDTLEKILTNNTIRFTQPSVQNDLFEMQLIYDNETEKSFPYDWQTKDEERVDERYLNDKRYLSLCLTKNPNNAAMWAHYGGNHTGALLKFDSKSKFFEEDGTRKLMRINYDSVRPRAFIFNAKQSVTYTEANIKIIENIIFTKNVDWSYEEEYRLIRPLIMLRTLQGGKIDEFKTDMTFYSELGRTGKYRFDPVLLDTLIDNPITEIYYGINMDEGVREKLYKLATGRNIKVFVSKLSDTSYKMEYVQLNNFDVPTS